MKPGIARFGKLAALGGAFAAVLVFALPAATQGQPPPVQARVTTQLNGRTGPGAQYPVLFVMPVNSLVPVYRCTQDITWCEVGFGQQTAWASAQFLQVLPQAPGTPLPPPQLGGGGLLDFVLGQLFGQPPPRTPPPTTPPPTPPQPRDPATNEICFYADFDYLGDFFCVRMGQSDTNLDTDWNNRISSLKVGATARIEVCAEFNFAGWCQDYVDNTPRLGSPRNDAISSWRAVAATTPTPTPPPTPPVTQACFFENANYTGASFCMVAGQAFPTLPTTWNNRISSIRITGVLAVQFCADFNYNGWCEEIQTSIAQLPSIRDNAASSVRVRVP